MKKILVLVSMLASSLAFAGDDNRNCQGAVLSLNEVKAELTKQGYKKIGRVEYDDCVYEVIAVNPSGDKVELTFEPLSKKVVAEESYYWD